MKNNLSFRWNLPSDGTKTVRARPGLNSRPRKRPRQ